MFLRKIEAKPAALLVESRTQQKSFLFLLGEKIGRAQNQKCRENFFAGWRAVASGGGLASLVWFRSGISDKISSSQTVKTHHTAPLGLPNFAKAPLGTARCTALLSCETSRKTRTIEAWANKK
ncbi:MAG: hypothetical protein HY001_01155 [Candidatus Portnoybacteria bacterium]|nr:hypothetical protein [Candidatus Portnoybacteria bacterium]